MYRKFSEDDIFFAEAFVRVVDMSAKGTQGTLVPFRISAMPMQQHFVDTIIRPGRTHAIELKARRVGGTTLFQVLGLVRAIRRGNFHVGLIAQNEPEALRFGRMWKQLFTDMIPQTRMPDGSVYRTQPEVGTFTDHTIEFPKTGSFLTVGTAGSTKLWLGQSFNMLIGTEVSRWDLGRPPGAAENTWAGVQGALVPGGFAVLESTAFGSQGFFWETFQQATAGSNGWTPVFYDWRWHPLYRLLPDDPDVLDADRGQLVLTDEENLLGLLPDQARWRRAKIATMPGGAIEDKMRLFRQEYPEDPVTCFSTSGSPFFDSTRIDVCFRESRPILASEESGRLILWQSPRVGESYVIGVDPGGEAPMSSSSRLDYCSATVIDGRGNHVASLH